jgi:hypothetical protein
MLRVLASLSRPAYPFVLAAISCGCTQAQLVSLSVPSASAVEVHSEFGCTGLRPTPAHLSSWMLVPGFMVLGLFAALRHTCVLL